MATEQIYHDVDVYGREKANGQPYELFNEEAVKNALILWLTSKAGDFIRNPEAGGLLDRILFKNMEGRSTGLFLFSLKNAVYKEFVPAIKILDLQLDKNYQYRTMKIMITYVIETSNNIQNVEIYTKDLPTIREQKEKEISYTGYNLLMFCTIRKVDTEMENEILVYSDDEAVYRWGKYKLVNLTSSDSYFEDIQGVCNG